MFFSFPLLQIKNYEKTECPEERKKLAREIYDNFIMKEMLSHTHVSLFLHSPLFLYLFFSLFQDYSKEAVTNVQKYLMKNEVPVNLFEVSHHEMMSFYALQINLVGQICIDRYCSRSVHNTCVHNERVGCSVSNCSLYYQIY